MKLNVTPRLNVDAETARWFREIAQQVNALSENKESAYYGEPQWRDIIGAISPKSSGAGSPARAVYAGGNIGDYAFAAGDVCDQVFHFGHDLALNADGNPKDMHYHVHWSHNGTSISGNVVFTFYYQVGKRDGTFTSEKSLTITYATTNIATTPRYKHFVHETQLSAAVATASLTANSSIEVDGLIVGTLKLTTLPTLSAGAKLFIHTADIHYQSTNHGTKNRASNFYT